MLARVDVDIQLAGVLADNHALVNHLARRDEHGAAILQGVNAVARRLALLERDEGTVFASFHVTLVRRVSMEDMAHDAVTLRAGQKLRAEADQTARRNDEFHAHIAVALVHIGKLGLALAEKLHDRPHIFLRHFDSQVFHRLAFLSVDGLVDNLRLADLQFITFATHCLYQNRKMQLAASGNFECVRRVRLLDPKSNVRLDFLEQAVADMTRRDKLPLASGERAGIDAEGHRKRRFVDIDCRQRFGAFRVGDRLADTYVAETRQCDDLADACAFRFYAF